MVDDFQAALLLLFCLDLLFFFPPSTLHRSTGLRDKPFSSPTPNTYFLAPGASFKHHNPSLASQSHHPSPVVWAPAAGKVWQGLFAMYKKLNGGDNLSVGNSARNLSRCYISIIYTIPPVGVVYSK